MNSYNASARCLHTKSLIACLSIPILACVNRKLIGASYEKWSTDAETCAAGFLKTIEAFATGCKYPSNANFDRAQRMIGIAKAHTYD